MWFCICAKSRENYYEGKVEDVFTHEDIIKEAGLEFPWLVKLNKYMNLPLFRKEEDLYNYWDENFGDNLKIISKWN